MTLKDRVIRAAYVAAIASVAAFLLLKYAGLI
jgi:hypothetical protein